MVTESCGVRGYPCADEAEAPIDRDTVLIAEGRDRNVDRRLRSVGPLLRLAELHGPARVAIFLPQFRGPLRLALGNAPFLDRLLLILAVAFFACADA